MLQKSLREGFGLTVTEAMWKGAAVIEGNVPFPAANARSRACVFLRAERPGGCNAIRDLRWSPSRLRSARHSFLSLVLARSPHAPT